MQLTLFGGEGKIVYNAWIYGSAKVDVFNTTSGISRLAEEEEGTHEPRRPYYCDSGQVQQWRMLFSFAAFENQERRIYGVQFRRSSPDIQRRHASALVFDICGATGDLVDGQLYWNGNCENSREKVGNKKSYWVSQVGWLKCGVLSQAIGWPTDLYFRRPRLAS